jgi:hypothetical protein
MSETDIQQTARFTREFLVMSLVPWMEKCVVEWNENVAFVCLLADSMYSSPTVFLESSPSVAIVFVYASIIWLAIAVSRTNTCTFFIPFPIKHI